MVKVGGLQSAIHSLLFTVGDSEQDIQNRLFSVGGRESTTVNRSIRRSLIIQVESSASKENLSEHCLMDSFC